MKNRLYGPKRMFCANVHKKEKNNTYYNGKEIVNHNKNNINWYNIIFIYFYLMKCDLEHTSFLFSREREFTFLGSIHTILGSIYHNILFYLL